MEQFEKGLKFIFGPIIFVSALQILANCKCQIK